MKGNGICRVASLSVELSVVVLFLLGSFAVAQNSSTDTRSATSAKSAVLYVSPQGNDSWSGLLAEPNASRTDGPLATPQGATAEIRRMRSKQQSSLLVTVYLRNGTYSLTEPWIFRPEDSGATSSPVTYTAYPNETPIISGGAHIRGWKKSSRPNLFEASVPGVKEGRWYFHQLFVNGERRQRARSPNRGFYNVEGDLTETDHAQFQYHGNDVLPEWAKTGDTEVVLLQSWTVIHGVITNVEAEKHTVTISQRQVGMKENGDDWGRETNARYWIENSLHALDSPGEWYLDRRSGVLYYWPLEGEEDLNHAEVIAPALKELVRFQGGIWGASRPGGNGWPIHPVHDIQISGLTFQYADWPMPREGFTEIQTAFDVPAAIEAAGAISIAIENNTLQRLGAHAIEFGKGCKKNRITHNQISDVGAGGIKIGEPKVPNSLYETTSGNTVSDNRIHDIGRIYPSGAGVFVGQSSDNLIAHNEIYDTYQIGIAVGFTWDFLPTSAINNVIEYNHLHDIGRGLLSDIGCVYTVGVQGAVIRNNVCHDVSRFAGGYGGRGLYTDEGSTDVLLENNLVYRTQDAAFHQNLANRIVLRNNIFAMGKNDQIARQIRRDRKDVDWTTLDRNIIYWKEGSLLSFEWDDNNYNFENNLYFNPDRSQVQFGKLTFEDWQKLGRDQHSVIADPKFTDPAGGDFSLSSDSPALKLGFKPIDIRTVGPRSQP